MKKVHWIILAVITAVSLIAQYSTGEHHHWWDLIPGFYAIYGFVGCILIVKISKWYGKKIVFRGEDYYDR
ncbi:MAG TPA: hypothetical protein ENN39_01365 [Desulfonatronum sp.]|mgnify:CR=1 FL=1|nr:hypothetical protein [Desulfonatronum sp.]